MTSVLSQTYHASAQAFNALEKGAHFVLDQATHLVIKILPSRISQRIKEEHRVEFKTCLLWYGVSLSLNLLTPNAPISRSVKIIASAGLIFPLTILAIRSSYRHLQTCREEMEPKSKKTLILLFTAVAAFVVFGNIYEGIFPWRLETLPKFMLNSSRIFTIPLLLSADSIYASRNSPMRAAREAVPELEIVLEELRELSEKFRDFIYSNEELKLCLEQHLSRESPRLLRDFRDLWKDPPEMRPSDRVSNSILARWSNLSFEVGDISAKLSELKRYVYDHPRLYECFKRHVMAAYGPQEENIPAILNISY